MWKDPIVDAIHKKREAYAKKFNYDIEKIAADLKEKEKKLGLTPLSEKAKKVVRPSKKSQKSQEKDVASRVNR